MARRTDIVPSNKTEEYDFWKDIEIINDENMEISKFITIFEGVGLCCYSPDYNTWLMGTSHAETNKNEDGSYSTVVKSVTFDSSTKKFERCNDITVEQIYNWSKVAV